MSDHDVPHLATTTKIVALALPLTLAMAIGSGCTRNAPAVKADPAASEDASPGAAAPPVAPLPQVPNVAPSAKADPPKAWTEPAMIAALARDCRVVPEGSADAPSPLSCRLPLDQTCAPDLCFDEKNDRCRPACAKACDDCGGACTTRCEACKAICKDAACTTVCATTCGACRQACLLTKDACTTGTCNKAYASCSKKLAAEWRAGGCTAACARVATCATTCDEEPSGEGCVEACTKKAMGRCPAKFLSYCMMGGDPTIN